MNKDYLDSCRNQAILLTKAKNVTEIFDKLSKMGQHHPDLQADVAKALVKEYEAMYPNITPVDMKARVLSVIRDLEKSKPEKATEIAGKLHQRDRLTSTLVKMFQKKMAEEKAKKEKEERLAKEKRAEEEALKAKQAKIAAEAEGPTNDQPSALATA